MYKARTGGGRKSVSGERYDPTEDDLDVTAKVVPKSDEQRKRLQESTSKIMLLNRLDEVNFQFCSSDGAYCYIDVGDGCWRPNVLVTSLRG